MKKFIITFCFAFVLLPMTAAADSVFPDVADDHQYFDAIEYVKDGGIVQGYDDGYYKPEKEINRAEFLKILLETKHKEALESAVGRNCFNDIVGDEWYAKYVCYGKDLGIINGYDDETFRPGDPINVIEALKVLLETMTDEIWPLSTGGYYDTAAEALLENLDETLSDTDGQWYEKYLMQVGYYSLMLDTWSSFDQDLTRGEMAEITYRADVLIQEPEAVQQSEDWQIVKDFVLENTEISETYFDDHFEYVESLKNHKVAGADHYYHGHWPIGIADAVKVKYEFIIDDAEEEEQTFEKYILLHNDEVIEVGDVKYSFYHPDGFEVTQPNDFTISSDLEILITKAEASEVANETEECVDDEWFFNLQGASENLKLMVSSDSIYWFWAEPQGLSVCHINAQTGVTDYFYHSLPY